MKFKQWLQEIGTPLAHGGIQDFPGEELNTNLPVQSKLSTKDGSSKLTNGPDANADRAFGFKSRDKKGSPESRAKIIHRDKRGIPMERIPPDIVY